MKEDVSRYLNNWQNEIDSMAQYKAMAEKEQDAEVRIIYENFAQVEERHVIFWEGQIRSAGLQVPTRRPSWRACVLIWLAKRFGANLILGTIAKNEMTDRNVYTGQRETLGTGMSHEERRHAEVLNQLLRTKVSGISGGALGRMERRHNAVGGNALRASVLGANDGLCSNLSLLMGVAGASTDNRTLIITGIAGLFAGACSMAIGEWLSVTSSKELGEREIRVEADEIALDPKSESEELRLIYEAKGLSTSEAKDLAEHMMEDPKRAIDTLAREELGIDPNELTGSANEAAAFSFALFSFGAIIPVLPFFIFSGMMAIVFCLIISGLGLFGFGALITLFTGRSVWISGSRQFLLGGMAAALTHLLGRLIGSGL